jgi:hypothetical protein
MKTFNLHYNFVNHQLEYPNGEVFALLTSRVTSEEAFEMVRLTNKDELDNLYKIGYSSGFTDSERCDPYDDHFDLKEI